MELVDYLRLLRRRWYLLVAALIVGGLGATAATHQQPRLYRASTTFYISDQQGRPVSTLLASSAQDRIATYATLAGSSPVINRVLGALPAGIHVAHIGIAATGIPGTIFMQLNTQADSVSGAFQLAAAYTRVFPAYITQFEHAGAGADSTSLKILNPPAVSTNPISPNPRKNLLLGLGLGLLVGLCGLMIAEALDNRMRTPEDIERASGLSLLATVPSEHRSDPLVAATRPRSQRAEAIRQLRTNIQFAAVDRTMSSIIVTSALAGEGKTSVSANLAVTFGAMGKRVILVDADLRKPSVAEFMSVEGGVGLTSVLIGSVSLDDALIPWGRDRTVSILTAGPRPANPSELLASSKMSELLEQLKQRADVIVIDTPPMLPVTDAAVLGAQSDGVVLIARINGTSKQKIKAAAAQLRKLGLPALGVVANWADLTSDYGYYGTTGRRRRADEELVDVAPAPSSPRKAKIVHHHDSDPLHSSRPSVEGTAPSPKAT